MSNAPKGIDTSIDQHPHRATKQLATVEMNEPTAKVEVDADLSSLIAGCRPDNLHPEADFGPPVGRETLNGDE